MGRHASDKATGFKDVAPGTYLARSFRIIDIGTHHGDYQGKPNVRNQFVLQWELPTETIEVDGIAKPMVVSRFYTNSLVPKSNLLRDLTAWRAREFTEEELKGFDLETILNKPCIVTIGHKESGKTGVIAVGPPMKGTVCPPLFNKAEAFWIEEWSQETFAALPQGFRDLIVKSDEYAAMSGPTPQGRMQSRPNNDADDNDDIPF